MQVKAHNSVKLEFLSSVQYSEPISSEQYHVERDIIKKKATDVSREKSFSLIIAEKKKIYTLVLILQLMKKAIARQQRSLREEHVNLWQSYWYTSLRISDSKAEGAINGHKINSTMYYVLSQVPRSAPDVEKNVGMNEGCYRGHHTL